MTMEGAMYGACVTIRVDASPRMGGGHVMRCLTLADMLASRGATATFVAASMLPGLADRITGGGHRLRHIAPIAPAVDDADWDSRTLPPDAQSRDAQATHLAAGPADLVVVDHYRLDADWEQAARPGRLLVIDDLANRRHDCDVLLDQTFGVSPHRYASLVDADCTLLAGAAFALLRPEFAAARPTALRRRRGAERIDRLLISLGSTDVDGITGKVVSALFSAGIDCAMDVVVPASAASLPMLRTHAATNPRLSIHVDSSAMADLMTRADLAIGAAGTTSWERCCLGLPTITLVLADNQRQVAEQLATAQAAIVAAMPEDAAAHALALMRDPAPLAFMIAACAAIVDGKGTDRVAEALAGSPDDAPIVLHLRGANGADSEQLWLWRNDPFSRAMATSSEPIAWPAHARWFDRIISDAGTELLIAERGGTALAMVRFDVIGALEALVSINVAPGARGRGIGRDSLSMACARYLAANDDTTLFADIHVTNAASIHIFTGIGFTMVGANGDFHRLALTRSDLAQKWTRP